MASRREKAAKIRHLLETEGDAVEEGTRGFNQGRYDAVADLEDYDGLKDEARAIKEDAIERLPELIEQVTEVIEARGGHVYVAEDAADANRYVEEEVVGPADAETVVKSKSMTTEEIELNEHLEALGVEVVETDLGEFVLQVADEAPSHLVAPGIHKSREEIADLFNETFDPDPPLETAEELTRFAREHLGERIRSADVGVTGANFVAADTGTLMLVTSEGNARKSVQATDTHVAVAGIEKLIPEFEQLAPFAELIGRSGTGQDLTAYLSLFTPPGDSPVTDFDDPESADTPLSAADGEGRDFHLVLLDNGRTAMREDDQLRETLYCIRCGACANTCGNFQQVGGHAFGGETYTGGIATGWEAGVHGLDSAAEFNDLCTGCSRCKEACPVKIDIPWINEVVRDRVNRGAEPTEFDHLVSGLTPDEEPAGLDLQKRFFGNFGTAARVGSALAPVSNWVADSAPARWAMERLVGVDRRRELPTFARESLVAWFADRGPAVPADEAAREAVLYPDVYTNYVRPSRGKAAVRVLEAMDVHVRVPSVPESGRAPLSQGMIATADDAASDCYAALAEHVDAGRDVVAVEPSDLAMFREDYEHLLPQAAFERLEGASYDLFEYVFGLAENGGDLGGLRGPAAESEESLAYHSHCQQRTMGLEAHTVAVLEQLGYDVATSDAECCGMAGSFGFKSEYYELSMAVGDELRTPAFEDDERTLVASGTSCLDQLPAVLERPARHPATLVEPGA
ncbi:MAG: LUD domain-containing protein [Halobacteriaceae archaeon]